MSERVDTVRLQHMVRAYRESGALMAAVELGLFTKLARGADTETALIEALGIHPLNAERIVIACIALGLIERAGDRLANAPDVARFLVEGEPGYAGAWMLFTRGEWDDFGRLGAILAGDRAPERLGDSYGGFTVEKARAYHAATASIGRGAGRLFLRHVNLGGRRRLLDIGGGSGAYCIEACTRYPDLRATVFELPPVAVVAREYIAENGMSGRIDVLEGDFTRDALPAGADVAVMASNLGSYGGDLIRRALAAAFAALAPGGEMHLIGHTLDATRSQPAEPTLWALAEAVHGSTGRAHSTPECMGYFRDTGFADVAGDEGYLPGMLTRISGRKPAS